MPLTAVVAALCGVMLYRMDRTLNIQAHNRAEKIGDVRVEEPDVASLAIPAAMPLSHGAAIKSAVSQTIPAGEVLMPKEVRKAFEDASDVLRRAVQFSAADSLATLVRHPDLTLPRSRVWHASRPLTPTMPLQIGPKFGVMEKLMVTTMLMQNGDARPVVLEKTAQSYLLDWESLVGWGECFFEDVPRLPSDQRTLLRVIVQPSAAMPPFTQEPGRSFILSHPEERVTLTAHATESMLSKSKAGHFLRAASEAPFTLRIAVDEACLKHGWVRIEEVVCSGWVTDL